MKPHAGQAVMVIRGLDRIFRTRNQEARINVVYLGFHFGVLASPKSSPLERTLKKSEVKTLSFGEGRVRQNWP